MAIRVVRCKACAGTHSLFVAPDAIICVACDRRGDPSLLATVVLDARAEYADLGGVDPRTVPSPGERDARGP